MSSETIFAAATAPGRAGVAVVRISGALAFAVAERMAGALPVTGRGVRQIRSRAGDLIDEALVLTFDHGKSFTGEAVVELHLHGSPSIVDAVLGELRAEDGLRLARPGEFSWRAMENGRMDLAQAEGLADLLEAETEAQRRQAMRVFSGGLGALCDGWRDSLIHAAALIEATIDFADEEVPVDVGPEVLDLLGAVRAELVRESAGVAVAERVREGFEVAIVGRPNAGKSTLLNYLVGRDAAITSEIAGTTRDVIEVRAVVEGLPVTFLDTAGLRDDGDDIERIGIARGRERAARADMRVYLLGPGEAAPEALLPGDIAVLSKVDDGVGGVSGKTGAGVDLLIQRIGDELARRVASVGRATSERHRVAMEKAIASLDQAVVRIQTPDAMTELAAADLRLALRVLDSLVGRVDVEDILGDIFSRFCIGK